MAFTSKKSSTNKINIQKEAFCSLHFSNNLTNINIITNKSNHQSSFNISNEMSMRSTNVQFNKNNTDYLQEIPSPCDINPYKKTKNKSENKSIEREIQFNKYSICHNNINKS